MCSFKHLLLSLPVSRVTGIDWATFSSRGCGQPLSPMATAQGDNYRVFLTRCLPHVRPTLQQNRTSSSQENYWKGNNHGWVQTHNMCTPLSHISVISLKPPSLSLSPSLSLPLDSLSLPSLCLLSSSVKVVRPVKLASCHSLTVITRHIRKTEQQTAICDQLIRGTRYMYTHTHTHTHTHHSCVGTGFRCRVLLMLSLSLSLSLTHTLSLSPSLPPSIPPSLPPSLPLSLTLSLSLSLSFSPHTHTECAHSDVCHNRLLFLDICELVLSVFSRAYFKEHFFTPALELGNVCTTLTHSVSLSLSLSHSLTHLLSLSLTYTPTHPLTHSLTNSVSHSLTSLSLTHTHTLQDPVVNVRLRVCSMLPALKTTLKLPGTGIHVYIVVV